MANAGCLAGVFLCRRAGRRDRSDSRRAIEFVTRFAAPRTIFGARLALPS
jgi:hypothetical protein